MVSPDSPVIDPLELLTNRMDRTPTVLGSLWNPFCGAFIGVAAALMMNWGFRKPLLSGLQRHITMGAIGGGIGYYFDGKRNDYLAERDAVLRHYVETHPDDFPKIPRQKYAEVLERWVPIR